MSAVAPLGLAGMGQSVRAGDGDVHADARDRTRSENKGHARRLVARVSALAACGALALVYGGASGWAHDGDERFGTGAGILFGLGVAAIPATLVGLGVAYRFPGWSVRYFAAPADEVLFTRSGRRQRSNAANIIDDGSSSSRVADAGTARARWYDGPRGASWSWSWRRLYWLSSWCSRR